MFVLAENLRIPARFKGRSEVSTTPRASFLLTQASRWLAMLQAVPLSVDTYPEKYRGQLTLSSGAQALIILGSVPPINHHYFYLSQHCLRLRGSVLCCSGCPQTSRLNSPSFLGLPVAGIIGLGHLYSSIHFTER